MGSVQSFSSHNAAMTQHRPSNLKVMFVLACTVLLWASAFVFIRIGLLSYSPGALALFRYMIASVGMVFVFLFIGHKRRLQWRDIPELFVLGAVGFGVYNVALNYGEVTVNAGITSFIIGQVPVVVTLLAVLFLGERLSRVAWYGMVISVLGVILISWAHRQGAQWDIGIVYLLLATLSAAAYAVACRYLCRKYSPIELTAYAIWGGTIAMLVYAPQLWREIPSAIPMATWSLVYLALLPGVVGYAGWSYVLSHLPASKTSSAMYFLPLLTTLLGWLMLSEVPAWLSLVGGVVAMIGAIMVVRAKKTSPSASSCSSTSSSSHTSS